MDQLIVSEKLESLRRCIVRIEGKVPEDIDFLASDADIQDILVLNLTRAVQVCVDIGSHIISESDQPAPQTMGEVFNTLFEMTAISEAVCASLKSAVGFRNIAVHNYQIVNWEVVFFICTRSLDDFRLFAKQVSAYAKL